MGWNIRRWWWRKSWRSAALEVKQNYILMNVVSERNVPPCLFYLQSVIYLNLNPECKQKLKVYWENKALEYTYITHYNTSTERAATEAFCPSTPDITAVELHGNYAGILQELSGNAAWMSYRNLTLSDRDADYEQAGC